MGYFFVRKQVFTTMINNMKYLSLLYLLCFLTTVQAEIYKSSDSEGHTVYSDQDLPNSEKMATPTENVIQMPKLIIITPAKDAEDGETYVYLNIDKPVNDEILRNNQGNVTVSISIKPALHTEDGDYLALYLDDKEVTPDAESDLEEQSISVDGAPENQDTETNNQDSTPDTDIDENADIEEDAIPDTIKINIPLSNINRGEHAIYAEVTNEDGDALITSNTVIFHMKRHSIQHNKAFGTTPGPRNSAGQPFSPGSQGITFKPGPIVPAPQ